MQVVRRAYKRGIEPDNGPRLGEIIGLGPVGGGHPVPRSLQRPRGQFGFD